MPEDQTCKAEEIVSRLIKDGWKMQKGGLCYLNGIVGTNLYKAG